MMCAPHSACIEHLPARCVSRLHSCCLRSLISAAASGSPYTPASNLAQRASASCLPEVASATWLSNCLHCRKLGFVPLAGINTSACVDLPAVPQPQNICQMAPMASQTCQLWLQLQLLGCQLAGVQHLHTVRPPCSYRRISTGEQLLVPPDWHAAHYVGSLSKLHACRD